MHRIFADRDGTTWLVLAVYPHAEERRVERDRRRQDLPVDPDRRATGERRQRVRREMERGWLVFKADHGRRRLTPIVDGWDRCSDEELDLMCRQATAAQRLGDVRHSPAVYSEMAKGAPESSANLSAREGAPPQP